MFIEYENNREDYIRGYEKLRKATIKRLLITNAMTFIALLFFPLYHVYRMSTFYVTDIMNYLSIILIGVVSYILLMFLLNKKTKKEILMLVDTNINLKSSCIGKKSIELIDKKIIYKGSNDRTEFNLSGIDNVFEYNNQVILCTQKLNPMFIIPSQYFESDEQKLEFIKIIKSKITIAK